MAPDRPAPVRLFALAAALLLSSAVRVPLAQAQVMEIGAGGAVTVYDRPAVFSDQGVAPLPTLTKPQRHKSRHGLAKAAAPTPSATGPNSALRQAATAAALSPELVEAVAWQEFGLRPGVISRAGAVGEMQLMPATARSLSVDPADSRQNYRGGAAYLALLLKRYDGDVIRALAAYNAGEGAVDRYGGLPPYKETQAYVAAILDRLSQRAEQTDR